jgi:mannosyltransferase OCH1-like enzyme
MKIHQILINDTNTLPDEFPEFHNICIEQIKKLYPDEEYHLYSGEELEKIIKNNFDSDIYISYKKLKPYACKADLARLCLLYLYGGLYIDLNLYFINTIPNLDKLKFFAFRDLPSSSNNGWSVQNGIMYSLPKTKIIKNTIDIIVNNCKNEYYGVSSNDVTATKVLGMGIMKSYPDHNIATTGQFEYFSINSFNDKMKEYIKSFGYDDYLMGFIMDKKDKLISIRKPAGKGDISSLGFKGTNNYVEMWKNKDVYHNSIKFPTKSTLKYQ